MSLEAKKKNLELERVTLARKELEYKVEEKLDEIRRLREHIDIQLKAEERIKQEISELNFKP